MKEVRDYIYKNWPLTFHNPSEMKGDLVVPKPYISPSIKGIYTDLYYWDTYFINLGLLEDGFFEQVENNLDNMVYFIEKLGYIPNSRYILDRSQPPLFASAVYDYYLKMNDKRIIEKYLPYILKEYEFFETKRKNKFGLNNFSTNASDELKMINYEGLSPRVLEYRETREEQLSLANDIMAIAESGLDFNMRFKTKRSKIDQSAFIHLDLNSFLFDVESKIVLMQDILSLDSSIFREKRDRRRELINKYLFDKENGIYLDYNYRDNCFSSILSAVSYYPYTYGISDDKIGLKKVIDALELDYGITVATNRGDDIYFQWDYPLMWPAATCMAYQALKRLGLFKDAKRIMNKYISAVDKNFLKTGSIFEKYNAITGDIGESNEYETPEMMGWSSGVYVYFCEELKRLENKEG